MIAVPAKYQPSSGLDQSRRGPSSRSVLSVSVAGILSGLLGVGGGTIMVPAIVFLLGRDQHVAQGVSLAVIIPVSLSGAWIHARKGNVIPTLGVWLAVGAVIGATVVGHAVQRYSSDTLRFLFGVFLVIDGRDPRGQKGANRPSLNASPVTAARSRCWRGIGQTSPSSIPHRPWRRGDAAPMWRM